MYPPKKNKNQIRVMIGFRLSQTGTKIEVRTQKHAAPMQEGTAYFDSWPPILLPITPLRTAPKMGAVMLVVVK